jgi:hypothetical protein
MSVPVAMVSAATGAPAVDVCTTSIVYVHITNCSISLSLSLSGSSAALQSVITKRVGHIMIASTLCEV